MTLLIVKNSEFKHCPFCFKAEELAVNSNLRFKIKEVTYETVNALKYLKVITSRDKNYLILKTSSEKISYIVNTKVTYPQIYVVTEEKLDYLINYLDSFESIEKIMEISKLEFLQGIEYVGGHSDMIKLGEDWD